MLYLVTAEELHYDEFDSFLVRAYSPVEAKLVVKEYLKKSQMDLGRKWRARKITCEGKARVLHGSFHAG